MKSFIKEIESRFKAYESELTESEHTSMKRWQDNDGDGKWYEPGVDVKENTSSTNEYSDASNNELASYYILLKQQHAAAVESGQDALAKMLLGDMAEVKQVLKQRKESTTTENSTSAGVPGYMTPKAFGKSTDKTVTAGGYHRVQEALDQKYIQLIEGYREFANGDPKLSPERKVKQTIREVSKRLREIEEMVKHTAKLKTESGVSKSGYGTQTERALYKISETLIKLSERVRSLGE
jgi:hypothetical protein